MLGHIALLSKSNHAIIFMVEFWGHLLYGICCLQILQHVPSYQNNFPRDMNHGLYEMYKKTSQICQVKSICKTSQSCSLYWWFKPSTAVYKLIFDWKIYGYYQRRRVVVHHLVMLLETVKSTMMSCINLNSRVLSKNAL